MLNYLRKKRGQSTLEYAILIVIIIAALLSIQVYIKRGVQGRFKSATDDIGDQFSPGITTENNTVTTTSSTTETFSGQSGSNQVNSENVITSMNRDVQPAANEYWGH
jgi:Flp pilus assembly pilin Flp